MRTNTAKTTFRLIAVAAVLGAAGCRPHPAVPLHVTIGLDASGGARPRLAAYAVLTGQIASRLTPNSDRLSLYRVDNHATEFSDRPVTGSQDEVLETVTANVHPSAGARGTYPAAFFTSVSEQAALLKDDEAVIYFSDADNDDSSPRARADLHAAAVRLAKNPHIRMVVFCGAARENFAWLHACFEPLGDARLHILGANEMSIEPIESWLQQAVEAGAR